MLPIGDRPDRLTLYSPAAEPADALGHVTAPAEEVGQVWGKVEFRGGVEGDRGGQQRTRRRYMVTILYRTDVRGGWTIYRQATAETLEVVSYGDPDGLRAELVLECVSNEGN